MKQLEICGTLLEEYPDFLGILTHVEKEVDEVQRKSKMNSLMVKTYRRLSGSLTLNSPRVETLNYLNISKCGYLKILSVASDLIELEELSISGCPMLEEPDVGHLSCLKKIRIADCNMNSVPVMSSFMMLVEMNVSRCPNLHELCLADLSWLKKLIVHHCDHLKSVTGQSHLLNLVEVSVSWCWMLLLDPCLAGLNRLKSITLDRSVKMKCLELNDCKDPETVSGISFEMIRGVNICGCPELKNFPVICGPNHMERIIFNGYRKLNYLTLTDCRILKSIYGNFDLVGLSISDCPMLQELPSLGRVIYLEEIRILKCRNLKTMILPRSLKRLELKCLQGTQKYTCNIYSYAVV
ncbi:uncharacterized protein LOC131856554 [Cryptomeria japonica]|uniref:uncharacterized protein LOC131856554 n=1 Tax=Cryptomeria japonica TaxID=3369 RepID=UPI0027DAA82D|nr:uncharacterized protein LOC131856554 [Cryptomeria japonica]